MSRSGALVGALMEENRRYCWYGVNLSKRSFVIVQSTVFHTRLLVWGLETLSVDFGLLAFVVLVDPFV